ncbi:hypothetical protein FACS1894107_11620 [Planctomycetales bacterium]|nr:hypothetical protein FACS1894107_11620 [Planctomycetales bacterium]
MQIHFLPDHRTVELSAGESLLTAARRGGVELAAPCNGAGVCGKCLVRVVRGQSAPLGQSLISRPPAVGLPAKRPP